MRFTAIFLAALMGINVSPASARNASCTSKMANEGEKAADQLKDWKQAYNFFEKYGKSCPEAGSEKIGAVVEDLLTKHWNKLGELDSLAREHADFKKFVLEHIDSTLGDPGKISELAAKKCPKGLDSLCEELAKKAKAALEQ